MFYVSEVRINKSGYDRNGQYWGTGQRLYYWRYEGTADCGGPFNSGHFRANDRDDAKDRIRSFYKSTFPDHIVFAR